MGRTAWGSDLEIGRVVSIQKNKQPVEIAREGEEVVIKIVQGKHQPKFAIDRHFYVPCRMCSKMSRQSINALKEHFKDEMTKEDWHLAEVMALTDMRDMKYKTS